MTIALGGIARVIFYGMLTWAAWVYGTTTLEENQRRAEWQTSVTAQCAPRATTLKAR